MQAKVLFVYLSVCLSAIDISGAVKYFCSQPNEVFLECGCHRNCRNPARSCGGYCEKGCFCKEGDLRDDDGDCVDAKYCPDIPFDELLTLEPYVKWEPVSPPELNTSKSYSEVNISDTSEPEEEEETEPYTRKSYTLEPFGKLSIVSQAIKLYTYNPFYDEDSTFRNRELNTLNAREGLLALSNTKNVYTLKLHNGQVSRNNESFTSKPRGNYNGLSYHKVLYSSKSRGEGRASRIKQLASMSRGKVDSVSQKTKLYLPKSMDKGRAVSPNKELFKTKNPGSAALELFNIKDPKFPEYFYTSKSQSKISPVSSKKELYKSNSLGKGGSLAQNKELYKSKSRGKMGSFFRSKELFKLKYYIGTGGPLSQTIELYTSESGSKGDALSPKELYKAKFRGNVGHVSPNKVYNSKFVGKGGKLSQSKELYTSKSRGIGYPVSPKELYTSKSRGKAGVVSQNKELYTSKTRAKGNTELHASKSMGNGSVVSYYKELNKFKSQGNGSAGLSKKTQSSKYRSNRNNNFKKSDTKKTHSKGRPAHNKNISGVKLRCPQNEEYRLCEHCNRTCEDPKPVCLAECSVGCFCKRNLLRDVDGSCVKLQRCSNIWKRMKRTDKDRK